MNILYLHGWGSHYDPTNEKIVELSKIGTVSGFTIDYCVDATVIESLLVKHVINAKIDLIVGTSLGGFWAASVGSVTGVPFVSINPALDPSTSLNHYIGNGITYSGNEYLLTQDVIDTYKLYDFDLYGCGLILLDKADKVVDNVATQAKMDGHYEVEMFEGGSHRFEHMKESLPLIKYHYGISQIVYN
ncbi:hypothetical protein NVP1081O_263 [Vibrio phage 1.081.O._10N.286.52.C2]|nr:hypothetical protein NVP1081O_263 [Vibrio phage 1.081.O._10N.286.52.C2]